MGETDKSAAERRGPDTEGLQSRRELISRGLSNAAISRRVRRQGLTSVRPGWYSVEAHEYPEPRHLLQIVGAVNELKECQDEAVVSHVSAAILHGLPIWGLDTDRVEITHPGKAGVASTRSIRPHRAKLTDSEITVVDGVRVTTLARTVLDIARTSPFTQGVVVADAALHRLLDLDELLAVWEIARSRRSASWSKRVFDFADGRAESVLESVSRVAIAAVGLPEPQLQVKIFDGRKRFVARTDFEFGDFKTVGESDGASKYTTLLKSGQTREGVLMAQKAREKRILATGRQVARWGMTVVVDDPGEVANRCVAAFRRAGFASYEPGPSRLPFLRWRSLQRYWEVQAG